MTTGAIGFAGALALVGLLGGCGCDRAPIRKMVESIRLPVRQDGYPFGFDGGRTSPRNASTV